eukprot:jgi/Psemu1/40169/gm1.40169_g
MNGTEFKYAYKFDYIYKSIIHNMQYFAKRAGSDLCIDELSWAFYGFGGPLVDYLKDKMVTHGGQTVILSDIDRVCPRGYLHRHKHYKKKDIALYIQRLIGTVARNKLPKGVPSKYFHKEVIADYTKKYARVARMCNPVTLVKEASTADGKKGNSLYVRCKERGRGDQKWCWAIEMNHARELYLNTHEKLDQIDAAISRANILYKSWKYYHSPINHAKALTIPTAYGIYKECTDMLEYDPMLKVYPTDSWLREATQIQGPKTEED